MIILGVTVMLITTLGIAFSGKIKEEINKKGWFANKNQIQAIVEQEVSGMEIAEQSNQENSKIAVQDSSVSTQAVDTSSWDLTKVDIVYDTANVAVPVPKGYVASGADGEHTVNEGFVIYEGDTAVTTDNAWDESCTRNQWVWVPVPDVSRVFALGVGAKKGGEVYTYNDVERGLLAGGEPDLLKEYDNEKYFTENKLQGMTREKFLHEMQEEFDFTIESIKRYGGFYIGRYETGNLSSKIPVVQRMNTDISNQTWYTGYSTLQRLGANGNVKSNMLFGCLWSETLQWLVDNEKKTYKNIEDSSGWGNYAISTFRYKTNKNKSTLKSAFSYVKIPTGSAEVCKANNIYDMAGNVAEWTLYTFDHQNRTNMGGGYDDTRVKSVDGYASISPDQSNNNLGFRAYLYIK